MSITLGTNLPAYTVRTKMNNVINNLTTTMERLSTGTKINRAGDDAAALVISQNMEATIRGSRQAMNNIQNAKAYLAVAEDGMVSIGDHFQRINDLLTNMANDTNDNDSRIASVREIIERLKEIDRLAKTTNFNGRTMLDGNVDPNTGLSQPIFIQMDALTGDDSTLDISSALTKCFVSSLGATLPSNLDPDSDDFKPTNENCRTYMSIIQDAIATLSTRRGLLGAFENRLDSSYDNMATRVQSLETAKSNYVDTDISEEATNLTQRQILEQVNIAMLTQANSLQQLAISLLNG